ncbi:hypothetical protein ACFY97_19000 [Streptomyces klenkii]|uniref:hypothetical protein n=1 Tax=Streptomyces klenkii TaxID=1420899 RepID=UPI0036E83483
MAARRGLGPDRPCVLPSDPSWIQDVRYLDGNVLATIADVASASEGGLYVLPADTYQAAAGLIGGLAAKLPTTADDRLYGLALPEWELEALWDVLLAFRRADAGEPETAALRELIEDLGAHCCEPARTVGELTWDLGRVAAVLMLDIPAVKTVATALALDAPRDEAFRQAYEQISAAWRAAGVGC